MQRIKVFSGGQESLEEQINQWLEKKGDRVQITHITQSTPSHSTNTILSVIYSCHKEDPQD